MTKCDKNQEEKDPGVRSGTTESSLWGGYMKAETWDKESIGEDEWGGTVGTPSGERSLFMQALRQERAPKKQKGGQYSWSVVCKETKRWEVKMDEVMPLEKLEK